MGPTRRTLHRVRDSWSKVSKVALEKWLSFNQVWRFPFLCFPYMYYFIDTLSFNRRDNKINRNWQILLVHSCGLSKPFWENINDIHHFNWEIHLISSRTMSKKQLIFTPVFFSLLFVSSTLSVNKLHRITLTENSHLNKILISRALLRQEKTGYFLLLSNGRLAFGKARSFSRGSGQREGRRWTRKVEWSVVGRHVGRRFGFLRDVHLLFVFFVVVSAVLALRWVHKPSWPTTFLTSSW